MTFLEGDWQVQEDLKLRDVRVGGEIVTPTSILVGEQDGQAAEHRGWLSAIVEVSNRNLPITERTKNIQELINAARKNGVPADSIAKTLDELHIPYQHAPNNTDTQPRPEQKTGPNKEDTRTERPISKSESSNIFNWEDFKNIPIDAIAHQVMLDESNPPLPDSFREPVGNMFDVDDEPTLSGKIIAQIYKQLMDRNDGTRLNQKQSELLGQLSRNAVNDFQRRVEGEEKRRKLDNKRPIRASFDRVQEEACFHIDGTPQLRHFMFYFNTPRSSWKYPHAPKERAYVTLGLSDAPRIHQLFVDLTSRLYDAGIDFNAKAACALAMATRTDNMVFYISIADQAKASGLIKEFLDERMIGAGHVQAAIPSPRDGLSWAHEPNQVHRKIWQVVTGSSEGVSFNSFVSTLVLPSYLDRLAKAHETTGNSHASLIYANEARRVRAIIEYYSRQTT